MNDTNRFRIRFGPYKTPRFRYGSVMQREVRGESVITGLSGGRIPWSVEMPVRTER